MHNGEASLEQTDTSKKALARQVELFRAMTVDQRLQRTFSMSASMREVALAGLRRLHPNDDDDALRVRLATLMYGAEAGERIKRLLARSSG
ncbi:MAG: hypothetical protein JNM17_26285 [Archangium sp.]|nr:hypothetical protein [Archangium sp.]